MGLNNPFGRTANGVFFRLLFIVVVSTKPVIADPFITTDQNPFSLNQGLPLPTAAALPAAGLTKYYVTFETSNTLNEEQSGAESLLLDFEAYHLRAGFNIGLSHNWALKINLPLIARGGGEFDNAIDNWHAFFDLPRANRPNTAHNQYHIRYVNKHGTLIDLTRSDQQLGDIQLSLGKQLISDSGFTSSIWSTIELPSGDESNLMGNREIDLSLYLATDRIIDSKWKVFSNIGLLLPGEAFSASMQTESQVWFGHMGISRSVIPELDLQLQLNGHTRMYKDTGLRLLGSTYELIVGGTLHVDRYSDINVAISEDIKVGASPDISLLISWHSTISE